MFYDPSDLYILKDTARSQIIGRRHEQLNVFDDSWGQRLSSLPFTHWSWILESSLLEIPNGRDTLHWVDSWYKCQLLVTWLRCLKQLANCIYSADWSMLAAKESLEGGGGVDGGKLWMFISNSPHPYIAHMALRRSQSMSALASSCLFALRFQKFCWDS